LNPYPLLILLLASAASASEDITVEAVRRGSAVEVNARATLEASHDVLWGTLTDYNRLAEFIPGMRVSRVIEWRGNEAIVEQVGEAKFLFFRFPIEVTVGSASRPPNAIDVRVLRGNLRRLDGGYRIESAGDGRIVLRWRGLIEPETLLPPLIGVAVLRSNIEDQFTGMVREVERREALSRARENRGRS
jgi:ribosome-associated toxin RatA of RatAB toxin-antitoxin module